MSSSKKNVLLAEEKIMLSQSKPKPLAIAIMGPTAAGKTRLSIELAKRFNTEIISVDSALVYRGLDIGSAKPDIVEQDGVIHHLLDICEPTEPYSAADFCRDAKPIIYRLVEQGKTPILVGGTMMYFKALLEGLSDIPAANLDMRERVEKLAADKGWQHIHDLLSEADPVSAQRIHPNHSQRLGRAYEVFLSTGKPMSTWQNGSDNGLLNDFDWRQMAIAPRDRLILHHRIAERFDLMLDNGLLNEVQRLSNNLDIHADLPAIRAVGYRQVWEYLHDEYTYDEMRDKGKAATRQLAKRQLTWLRGWKGLNWLYTEHKGGEVKTFSQIVTNALNFLGETPL